MLRTLIFTATFAVLAAFVATTANAGDAAAGKTLYDTNCMSCHGMTGKGDGPVGAVLTPRPRDFSTAEFKFDTDGDGTPGSDADLTGVIKKGASAFGGSPLMAPWPSLSDDEIANLIAFIRSLKQ
jgi:mono/diheme cytochrome c family protein